VRVTVLEDRSGRLFISPSYRELLTSEGQDEPTRRFLRQRVAGAAWFIRALEQRRRTLENVTRIIFERQKDFLSEGDEGLKPLTMDEVAARVGLHVSTVSRAVAGKVVDTPRGNYRLKDFFTGSLAATPGTGENYVAAGKVKALLHELISSEDKTNPRSDEELVAALAGQGVRVARRTVAKYRNELRIPGSHERKTRI
jgi:RNA polymerase sigma-54 factor